MVPGILSNVAIRVLSIQDGVPGTGFEVAAWGDGVPAAVRSLMLRRRVG
jgi:hypothetical protein